MPSAGRRTSAGTATLAVGKPSSRPRLSPCCDLAPHLVGPAEQEGGAGDVALGEQRPDAGGGHDLAVLRVVVGDEVDAEHVEAELGAHLLEHRDAAAAVAAEVEVVADDDGRGAEAADEDLPDEVLRRLAASAPCRSGSPACSRRRSSASSSMRCSRSVSSSGADSGRTTVAGWRSKVTTALAAPSSVAMARTRPMSARWPRWTPS